MIGWECGCAGCATDSIRAERSGSPSKVLQGMIIFWCFCSVRILCQISGVSVRSRKFLQPVEIAVTNECRGLRSGSPAWMVIGPRVKSERAKEPKRGLLK